MPESEVAGFVKELELQLKREQMQGHIEYLPAREAQYRQPEANLHPQVLAAMRERGALRTYTHQADAIDAVIAGRNVVVSTSTASGKSLCFHAPVMHTLLNDTKARALYLYPTKALGHDQHAGMKEMMAAGGIDLRCETYDGDTPRADRGKIRNESRIIISNVDMLQVSMLPIHNAWRQFLSNLKYVVLDEAHYYRGVFGSHVAMILRRLRRILREFGATPQFILCSATIANAGEHAERLAGLPFDVISSDGSPSGERAFVLMDSAFAEEINGASGVNMQSAGVTAALMRRGVRTLTFSQSRAGAESIVQYTQEYLNGRRAGRYRRPELEKRIKPYRAGYMAQDRRLVEEGLRSGDLLAVASTNALELGIDIGTIEATVITGFPGTIASSWQQAGRSGRAGKQSLSLMLLRDNPVDAFYCRFPAAFFAAAHESALISLDNENILRKHLECAAWEVPLTRKDFDIFGEHAMRRTALNMVNEGKLVVAPDFSRHLPPESENPSFGVNIRSSDNEKYRLFDRDSGKRLEETTRMYALRELYPGGVYAHKGERYRVMSFDDERQEAELVPLEKRVYTQADIDTNVEIIDEFPPVQSGRRSVRMGRVRVSSRVLGYYEKNMYARDERGEFTPVDMPALEFETEAVWFCERQPNVDHPEDGSALHSIAHVGTGALAMLTMCDRRDFGAVAVTEHPQIGQAATFIYEDDIGGIGLTDFVARNADLFVQRMMAMVSSCMCEEGCPGCIESTFCNDDVDPPSKDALLDYFNR